VAGRITAYLVGVQERLKAAELARVEAQTRAAEEAKRRAVADELAQEAHARAQEEQKRRRLTAALAASVLITVAVVGGGWTYLAQQRAERLMVTTRVVADALAEAERLRGQAQSAAGGDLSKWSEATGAAKRARTFLAQGEPDDALQTRVATALLNLEREQAEAQNRAAEAERDRKLLSQLETIRGSRGEHWDAKRTDAEYGAAFSNFGIDPDQLDPKAAGNRIAQRSAVVELASYLDDWALNRRMARRKKDEASWRRLLVAAQVADPDPWRVALREQFVRNDREAIGRLAADQAILKAQTARSLLLLGLVLIGEGERDRAGQVLRRAWWMDPGDFWVNMALGDVHCLERNWENPEEAARYYSSAVALRPRSSTAYNSLGSALHTQVGQDRPLVYTEGLPPAEGYVRQRDRPKLDEAIAAFRESIRLEPNSGRAHGNLGRALRDTANREEAMAELRTAIRLDPDEFDNHINLGALLCDFSHEYQGASAEFREALRLKPDDPVATFNLGRALSEQGKVEEAFTFYRKAIRLKPDYFEAHLNLGVDLGRHGNLEEAIAELRAAVRLKPDNPGPHVSLGAALSKQGKVEDAIAEYRTALRLKADSPFVLATAHHNLGIALRSGGEFAEAVAELRKARDLGRSYPRLVQRYEQELTTTERQASLAARLPAVLEGRLNPGDAAETLGFAQLSYTRQLYGSSARLMTEAFQTQSNLADDMQSQHRYNAACAAALAGSGQGKDDPPLDEPARVRWRKQALDWLKADVAAWNKILKEGPPQARQPIPETIQHWKTDPDLAALRDPAALAKLPADEQNACRALWANVDATLRRAHNGQAQRSRPPASDAEGDAKRPRTK
jgi:tetratricopeptide (TPR) repeat protein